MTQFKAPLIIRGEVIEDADREFGGRRVQAEKSLAKIRPASGDDRVYQLGDADQVIERARAMLASAKMVVLADAFPKVLPNIAPQLESAAKRGVKVAVRVYEPVL